MNNLPDLKDTAGLPHPGQSAESARALWGNAAREGSDANAGLLFQRFFHGYSDGFRKPVEPSTRKIETPGRRPETVQVQGGKDMFAAALIAAWDKSKKSRNAMCGAHAKRIGDIARAQTEHVLGQQRPALAAREFTAAGRWLTGSGTSHPMEVGLAFHHTLGVPYLCGAAVKGLVRAWFELASDEGVRTHGDHARFRHLFEGEKKQAGSLVFFDALPVDSHMALNCDVMTPHHTGWYQWDEKSTGDIKSGKAVPADWQSPVPVPFLAVAGGMKLQFAIAPTLRLKAVEDKGELASDLETVWDWLESALFWFGAGAKTAAGYGRFESVSP